jgi:hypothetical protein
MEVSMRSSLLWIGFILGGLPLLASCEEAPVMPDHCNVRLAVVNPDPATLMVGQEVTLEAQLTASPECLPADASPGSLRWTSNNTGVATADAESGRVKAISNGSAEISLTTARTHTLLTTSTVQVTP